MPSKKQKSLDFVSSLNLLVAIKRKRKEFAASFNSKKVLTFIENKLKNEDEGSAVTEFITGLLEHFPDPSSKLITFSSVENSDISGMELTNAGVLQTTSAFKEKAPSTQQTYFFKKLGERWNLSAELARRTLIDIYLLDSFEDLSEETDDLAIFPEYFVKPISITASINITGQIDYVVGTAETKNLLARKQNLKYGSENAVNPFCCIVEAKCDESWMAGKGQLLAEMKALWKLSGAKSTINGILTDGLRWNFYRLELDGQGYKTLDNVLEHPKDSGLITSILPEFIIGQLPNGIM